MYSKWDQTIYIQLAPLLVGLKVESGTLKVSLFVKLFSLRQYDSSYNNNNNFLSCYEYVHFIHNTGDMYPFFLGGGAFIYQGICFT